MVERFPLFSQTRISMANPHHTTTIPRLLNISGVSIDFSNLGKNVESAEVRIGKSHRPIEREAGKALQQTFSPPLELCLGDLFSLHVRWKKWLGRKIEHEDVNFDTEEMFWVSGARGEPEKQEYIKFHQKIKIVVDLSRNTSTEAEQLASPDDIVELQPTTDEIIHICPRFRILVIGKTGVGKSSLINHAFGVENAVGCSRHFNTCGTLLITSP
ncbi:uncharacterized protein EDB91DRAFT_188112 [Suillus paluster]|uniref:uncharacterized protein n=1 Tax=Suillus paluster TaxID=48578 RepID=UPI001B871361|nr:uncharacterized protein EDB91DRAFT_188112 [Suillus paluster]KAG1744534.1 hypothetical protein EDB91DRAFT_188112 [Suillus paluster]